MNVVDRIVAGDVRSAARLIRDIDDGLPQARETLRELYAHTGRAYIVGVTGAPGVGKSTLVDRFIQYLREQGKTVGVLAVDPTSPFSGGAILGDRVRMQRHSLDEGVFIRSMATRGHFGGLTPSTRSVINVMDAMGKDFILVETVGVGQDEVDIVRTAHTTMIVLIPGMGDDIQAIKAGILEVGDLFVINKADRDGADKTVNELRQMLELGGPANRRRDWTPPILKTEAVRNQGIAEVFQAVDQHREYLMKDGGRHLEQRLHMRMQIELLDLVKDRIIRHFVKDLESSGELRDVVDDLVHKKIDPYTACDRIVRSRVGG